MSNNTVMTIDRSERRILLGYFSISNYTKQEVSEEFCLLVQSATNVLDLEQKLRAAGFDQYDDTWVDDTYIVEYSFIEEDRRLMVKFNSWKSKESVKKVWNFSYALSQMSVLDLQTYEEGDEKYYER